jgi:anti-sigma regulatory factor (Ser/Thr protein kinase)
MSSPDFPRFPECFRRRYERPTLSFIAEEAHRKMGGDEMGEPGIAQIRDYRLPLPPHAIASRQAHKVLEWALSDWRVHDSPADDAHIVLGELVTNALAHSMDVFGLALRLHGDQIHIEVWDRTDATPEIRQLDELAINGRGMFLVDALSKEWGVRPERAGGKTVWARISR